MVILFSLGIDKFVICQVAYFHKGLEHPKLH